MNRHRKGAKRRRASLRVWTYAQARQAIPYVTSVMGSLREHALAAQGHGRKIRRLAEAPGRPDRDRLVTQSEESRSEAEAVARFHEAEDELHAIDVYCLDPIRGEAALPFVHDNQLAWFLFDLFDAEHIHSWRYHTDPLEGRRPIAEALTGDDAPRVA